MTSPPRLTSSQEQGLLRHLGVARQIGLLGPGDLDPHIRHALGFAAVFDSPPAFVADLGSGAGLPGSVLAVVWPETRFVLVDSSARRTEHLEQVVTDLELSDRVEVQQVRAEELGQMPQWREQFDAVVARSFAAPPVVAEVGGPLLAVGGSLVTSEPPTSRGRWEAEEALASLGLVSRGVVALDAGHFHRCEKVAPTPDEFPRRVGLPAKRPLF